MSKFNFWFPILTRNINRFEDCLQNDLLIHGFEKESLFDNENVENLDKLYELFHQKS